MVIRYSREEAQQFINVRTVSLFECPGCAFAYDAIHEVDDEEGGYDCPICALDELMEAEE